MNFTDFIDKSKQKLVNDVNTIANSLTSIFDLNNASSNSEKFYTKVNGLCYISAEIINNRIQFTVRGVTKFRIAYDGEKTEKNIRENLFPNLSSKVSYFTLAEYNYPVVTIVFNELTQDSIADIMLLVNNSEAKLKPSHYKRF
jgi:hypothetical protein